MKNAEQRLARVELRRLLSVHPEFEIAGEAANIEEAKTAITELAPDLLLLDIQMPAGTGFDLLNQIEFTPFVIFTTGYDEVAVQAFEVNALDYLLKPITAARLAAALEKAALHAAAASPKLAVHQQIFIKDGERCWFVKVQAVVLLESEGNYTRVFFGPNRPSSVARCALSKSVSTQPCSFSGGFELSLRGGIQIEMSRRRAVDFRVQMSL